MTVLDDDRREYVEDLVDDSNHRMAVMDRLLDFEPAPASPQGGPLRRETGPETTSEPPPATPPTRRRRPENPARQERAAQAALYGHRTGDVVAFPANAPRPSLTFVYETGVG